MSERPVSGFLLREMVQEQLALLTLDWYRGAFKEAIERELVQVARPKADPWRQMDNIRRGYEYKAECERTTVMLWELHRNAFRQRWEDYAERQVAKHGDYQLMLRGGSTHEMILWMLGVVGQARDGEAAKYVPGVSACDCERQRKLKEWAGRRQAAEARGAAPEGFEEAIVLEEVA